MPHALALRLLAGVDRPWRQALQACAVLAFAMMAWWAGQLTWGGAPASLAALAAAWLATAAVAAYGLELVRRARCQAPLDLAWDGVAWSIAGAGASDDRIRCHVRLRLDAGHWLLLDIRPQADPARPFLRSKATAVALHAGSHPSATWHALRGALYAPTPLPREVPGHER